MDRDYPPVKDHILYIVRQKADTLRSSLYTVFTRVSFEGTLRVLRFCAFSYITVPRGYFPFSQAHTHPSTYVLAH